MRALPPAEPELRNTHLLLYLVGRVADFCCVYEPGGGEVEPGGLAGCDGDGAGREGGSGRRGRVWIGCGATSGEVWDDGDGAVGKMYSVAGGWRGRGGGGGDGWGNGGEIGFGVRCMCALIHLCRWTAVGKIK